MTNTRQVLFQDDLGICTRGGVSEEQVLSVASHIARVDNPHQVTKGQVGLGNVTDDTQVKRSEMGVADGVATLDTLGKVPQAQIPDIAIVDYLGEVGSEVAMLALSGEPGDWCIRSDLGTVWIVTGPDPTQLSSWTQMAYPTAPVTSVNTKTGAVVLVKGDVGLGDVPNVDATNPENITQDTTHRFVSDIEKGIWNGKQDALGFTPVDWTDAEEDFKTTGSATAGSLSTVGDEFLDDPSFDDPAAWDVSAGGWTITGGQAIHAEAPTDLLEVTPTTIEANVVYRVEWNQNAGSDVTITIGGVAKSGGSSAGTKILHIKTVNTSSFVIRAIGDVTIDYMSLKKVGNAIVGDLLICGELSVLQLSANKLTLVGLNGVTDLTQEQGGDAPFVLSVIGGDGGYGYDATGDGSPIIFQTGSSPESGGISGNGGAFTCLTGNGRSAGVIDLDTGLSYVSTYGPRGLILLGKSGGRVGIGGILTPTALLHIAAGSTVRPPLQFTEGVLSSTIYAGALEYDSVTGRLYFSSNGSTRRAFVEGSGVSGRIPYWSGTALTTDTGFEYMGVNQRVRVANGYEVFDKKVVGEQQPHIIDASGTLEDVTSKFNTLLSYLETHGLLASA